MRNQVKSVSITAIALLAVIAAAAAVFVFLGIYDIGADAPHTRFVHSMIQTARDRSIQVRSADLSVPKLDDPQLVLKGAGQYAAMCTECHLAPGEKQSELRAGLYPQPPKLAETRVDAKRAFWVIKHGIKMTAMPAWGSTHDDATIWSMVAFLQKLPGLTPEQYKDIVAKAPADEDMDMEMKMGPDHGPPTPLPTLLTNVHAQQGLNQPRPLSP